jgi:hypothetical protein
MVKKKLSVAEDITKKYNQLSKCYSVLAAIRPKEVHAVSMYRDWRIYENELDSCGVDKEEVYKFIKKLVSSKKLELELELENLNCE